MYDALLFRLINRAHIICVDRKNSQECKVAWDQVEDVARARRTRKVPPPQKIDRDKELSEREYDI